MPITLPDFQGRPMLGQFAQGGVWEQAWFFGADALPGDEAVTTYLANSTELAFEAFFGPAFFGVRRRGSTAEVRRFALDCVNALRASHTGSFFAALQQRLQLPVAGAPIAFMELGCVNAWRSVGALRFDDPMAAAADFETTWQAVQASAVAQDTQHPKALELAFHAPLPHWFGVPVSALQAPFGLSREALQRLLARTAAWRRDNDRPPATGVSS